MTTIVSIVFIAVFGACALVVWAFTEAPTAPVSTCVAKHTATTGVIDDASR